MRFYQYILAFSESEKYNQAQMESKRSSIFTKIFPISQVKKRRDLLLSMTENNNFSDGLTPSRLSVNHETLSENI